MIVVDIIRQNRLNTLELCDVSNALDLYGYISEGDETQNDFVPRNFVM